MVPNAGILLAEKRESSESMFVVTCICHLP
uniref:Uncharacterized protein n=1 Tax=Arundo donax TaxID=35708 RepID=A0A0A9AZT9_ARUDO